MDILFESTKKFEKDLKKLTPQERERIIEKINLVGQHYLTSKSNAEHVHVYRPLKIKLEDDTTLFAIKVSPKLRVLFTLDEDPLFDQIIMTLFRITSPEKYEKVLKGISESLYQDSLHYVEQTS